MRHFKNTLKTFLVVIVFTVTTNAFALPFSQGKEFAHAIVRIEAGSGAGTGFFVEPGYLVTNEHVVGEVKVVNVYTEDGRVYAGKVEKVNKDLDLALVRVPNIGNHRFLQPSQKQVDIGFTIRTIAHTFGLPKSYGEGKVIGLLSHELDMPMEDIIFFSAPVSFGASGSPLLDEDFKVVGVVVAIVSESDFALAIPLPELIKFLEGNDVQ